MENGQKLLVVACVLVAGVAGAVASAPIRAAFDGAPGGALHVELQDRRTWQDENPVDPLWLRTTQCLTPELDCLYDIGPVRGATGVADGILLLSKSSVALSFEVVGRGDVLQVAARVPQGSVARWVVLVDDEGVQADSSVEASPAPSAQIWLLPLRLVSLALFIGLVGVGNRKAAKAAGILALAVAIPWNPSLDFGSAWLMVAMVIALGLLGWAIGARRTKGPGIGG